MLKTLSNLLESEPDPAFYQRAKFIIQAVEKFKPKKILEVGCGRGFYLKAFSYFTEIKQIDGIDVNTQYLKIAKQTNTDKRVTIQKASVYQLPYQNNHFDLILCTEVMEHLKNDVKALIEIKRVLKKGGHLIITVPHANFPFLWDPLNYILMRWFNQHVPKNIWWLAGIWADHERLYSSGLLKKSIHRAKFKLEKIVFAVHRSWPLMHFWLYGIGKNLVSLGLFSSSNRFNYQEDKPSRLAKLTRYPNRNESLYKDDKIPTVNILAILKK